MRHDLWDRDSPALSTLVQLERGGNVIDAMTLTARSGHLYVFDRKTGVGYREVLKIINEGKGRMAGGGRMGPPSGSEYFAFSLP